MGLNISKQEILTLKKLAKDIKFLYVEDNKALREKATQFFKRIFENVFVAKDGEEGLKLFHEIQPSIVVTDIEMPGIDGLDMARKIHKQYPHIKIIVTSAYDDSKKLYEAIESGIYRFLKKPLALDKLTEALSDAIHDVKLYEEQQLFDFYVKTIFNFQHNLLILYKNDRPIIVNDTFLKFFDVEDLESFNKKYTSIGEHFLEHNNFLYNTENLDWYEESINHINKLYHVKMMNQDHEYHHFIFRMTTIENKDNYYLASFDDVTDLNLLKLFDDKRSRLDEEEENQATFINLLESIQRNHDEVKLFNLYKGLTVTNKGLIVHADEHKIALQANYIQQRCAEFEKKIILSHPLFPADILCRTLKYVNYENQTIAVADLKFLTASPTQRQSIRLTPEDEHKVSLFYQEHKFGDHVKILNISSTAVRLSMLSLPAGFQNGEEVVLDMVFPQIGGQPLIINSKGEVMYIMEEKREFHVVITLKPNPTVQKSLITYLSKRQMALIREFKGLQYGK